MYFIEIYNGGMKMKEIITELMRSQGMSEAELARRSGTSQPNIHRIKSGATKTPKDEIVRGISKVFGITPAQLRGELPLKTDINDRNAPHSFLNATTYIVDNPSSSYEKIAVSNIRLSAGVSGMELQITEKSDIEPVFYQKAWLKKKGFKAERLIRTPVSGSSMEPALFSDDLVLINRDSTQPKNGLVFALNVEGEPLIKRIRKRDGVWWITSDNQAHSNSDLPLESTSQIIGEIVEKSSNHI